MDNKEELEERLKKLLVRLNNIQEGKQLSTMVQIIDDLLSLTYTKYCEELFKDKSVHVPLMLVLSLYITSRRIQQVGWHLLCRLIEICPGTLDELARPLETETDWEIIGVNQQILKVLSRYSGDSDVTQMGLQTLSALLRSDEILMMILEEMEDVFDLVVGAMKNFPDFAEIQLQGCQALHLLLKRVSEAHLLEFVEEQDHSVVLTALSNFHDREEVVFYGLKVLGSLAGPAMNVETLMSKNEQCYLLACQVMEAFCFSEAVQEEACSLLQKLTSESYYNILVLNGVHKAAVKACRMYPHNAQIQTTALTCLAKLTEAIIQSKGLERQVSDEEGDDDDDDDDGVRQTESEGSEDELFWADVCCTALEQHAEDAQVQEAACCALNSLLECEGGLRRVCVEEVERPPMHTLVMTAMLSHSCSESVFKATARALCSLIHRNGKIGTLLLSLGIHFNVFEILKKHANSAEACVCACQLLHTLFQRGRVSMDVGLGALRHIRTVMQRHNFDPEVQLQGLRASLVLHNPDRSLRENGVSVADPDTLDVSLRVLKTQSVVEGAHSVYLECLNRFLNDEAIQECGLGLLVTLADCSGAVDLMCQQGAIDTVLHSLQMYPQKRETHHWGLSLLCYLVSKKKLSRSHVPVLASTVVQSIRTHKEDEEMLLKGLLVAFRLLDACSGAAAVLAGEGLERDIFQQLRDKTVEQGPDTLQRVCCLCLSKMVLDPDIRYGMLEHACEDGDVDMAECLIELGADINKKTKTDSLIYQVCERGGPVALVDLLIRSGVHEQQLRGALTASVRRGDGPVVVLLLARLGLDPANNALCLGGFRLSRLEPSWLGALLSDRRAPPPRQRNSRGQYLARQIQTLQRKKCHQKLLLEVLGDPFISEYLSEEENEDWVFISPQSSPVCVLDSDADWFPRMVKVHSAPGELRSEFDTGQQDHSRRALSESTYPEPNDSIHMWIGRISENHNQKELWSPETPSPTGSQLARDRERIRLLDLSGNELNYLSCLMDEDSVQLQLGHLFRLDLSQNSLSELPSYLCQSLQSLTRLDLQDNQLTSLPAELLSLPVLSVLNVSRNHVGPELLLNPEVQSPSLRQLNLSFNKIVTFPYQLCHAMHKLEELSLEGNQISELCVPLCMAELKVLDVSKNVVQSISSDFLSQCFKLETLNASVNKLSDLSHLPPKLTTLKLAQNNFSTVPKAILSLPSLRSVDMKSNHITVLPGPPAWASGNLRELIFGENQISVLDLSGSVSKWIRLEKLHLNKNKLTEIPREIGQLEDLMSLDVSRNSELRSFPDELGKLGKLWDLPLNGLRLQLDLKQIGKKTKDIVRFLRQRLKKAVPYFRMKLIVVGNPGSGKTTLIQQLMKLKRSQWRSDSHGAGIHIRDWAVRYKDKKNMILNVWDFSGGEEYSGALPHFLTSRALYLVVYDPSKGSDQVDSIKPWLFNIKTLAPTSPVILVGTHMDECENSSLQECVSKIQEELQVGQGFPVIRDHHTVSACTETDSLSRLRKAIIKEVTTFKLQGQLVMGQLVPECYVELEKRVLSERVCAPPEFPVLQHSSLLQIIQENQLQLDEGEIPHAVHFLSNAGILLHFEDPVLQLREVYFIDPQWLCNIISQSLSVSRSLFGENCKALVQSSAVEKFLVQSRCFPKEWLTQYLKLLETFLITLPFGEGQLLVPGSLPGQRPSIDLPHFEKSEVIVRLYEMRYFPMGFWTRHISRLLEVSSFILGGTEKALKPRRVYWKTGVYLQWSSEAYCVVEASTPEDTPSSFIKITVPCSRKGRVLLGQIVDHIDSLLEEWFPGLLTTDIHGNGEAMLKKWVLYSFDDGQEWRQMLLEDLAAHIEQNNASGPADCLLKDPADPRSTVPVTQISPDLLLSDQPACIMLNPDQLQMNESKEYLLGDGGFGSVYRAVYKNEDVAVKVFKKHATELYVHRLVRQELTVLGRLHHPSLVGLLAAGTSPYRLVMELAPRGSLDSLFEHENGSLNRKLQHRIALQVADGLRYLHKAMIIYRDLKPHNVLLFNLRADSEIIAKITDYGIAQYCCSMGVRSSEGTPGFRAPEVARGNVIYNVKADVFSFGLLLYDLLTCGERIVDGMKFPSEFDEIVVQGKLPDPVKHYGVPPWPGFQELMRDCLRESPPDRPTSAQVFERLNSGEMLCLMREVMRRGLCSECLAVTGERGGDGGRVRVWTGGGSRGQKKGCLTSLDLETEESVTQKIDSSPVLCLVAVRVPGVPYDWLVAGTEAGSLIVIDTKNAQLLHSLKKVTDSVTSLYFHTRPKSSYLKNYLLVGTANGSLFIYEDTVIGCEDGAPVKEVRVGEPDTPVMGLSLSAHSHDRKIVWAACGSRVLSLTMDYEVWKTMDTKPNQHHHQQHVVGSEAPICRLAVEKHVYVSRTRGCSVEVWDKKSQKIVHVIDYAQLLRCSSKGKRLSNERAGEDRLSLATIKALLVQPGTALWIGTRQGHILLVDLSTHQPLQLINTHCQSIRAMASVFIETLNRKDMILVLGRRLQKTQDLSQSMCDGDSVMVWNSALPLEVKDLNRHCELREEIAAKMREQLHD